MCSLKCYDFSIRMLIHRHYTAAQLLLGRIFRDFNCSFIDCNYFQVITKAKLPFLTARTKRLSNLFAAQLPILIAVRYDEH